jgi:hypothetical protein
MRLGDDIDDHCSRCKRSTDHAIVAMAGEEVLKTRCRTCNNEHAYRHNQGRKKEMTAKEAFDKLVSTMPGSQADARPEDEALAAPRKGRKRKNSA